MLAGLCSLGYYEFSRQGGEFNGIVVGLSYRFCLSAFDSIEIDEWGIVTGAEGFELLYHGVGTRGYGLGVGNNDIDVECNGKINK